MFVNEAIPLIEIKDDDTFTVNQRALSILLNVKGKVSVVAVAGLYRTGKSALLNWLLGNDSGFTVGPTVNRCTRGLWMWGTPKKGVLSNGEECSVLVLDTEGLGGIEADSKYDARIFSLAILLCSTLIYNSLGSIDENAISNLSFITQIAQHIKLSSTDDSEKNEDLDASNFYKIFPSFIWVIRDFTLDLVDTEGEVISSTQYLNMSLEATGNFDKISLERDRVRNMISAFFTNRKCVTLVRPVSDEDALQRVDQIPFHELRNEFQEGIKDLQDSIYVHLQPKCIDGKPLNGPMFGGLVEAYVHAINSGGVPTISTAWEGVSQQECLNAKDAALDSFRDTMNTLCSRDVLPLAEEAIGDIYSNTSEIAMSSYKQRAVGVSAKQYQDILKNETASIYDSILQLNRELSSKLGIDTFNNLYSSIIVSKMSPTSSVPEYGETYYAYNLYTFRNDWNELFSSYYQVARGPCTHEVLADLVKAKMNDCIEVIVHHVKELYEQELNVLRDEIQRLCLQLSSQEAENRVMKDSLVKTKDTLRSVENEKRDLLSKCSSQSSTIEELTVLKRQLERSLEEEIDHRKRCEDKNKQLSKRVEDLVGKENEVFELRLVRDRQQLQIQAMDDEVKALHQQIADMKSKKCVVS